MKTVKEIESLRSRIAELEKANEWLISIVDMLPLKQIREMERFLSDQRAKKNAVKAENLKT